MSTTFEADLDAYALAGWSDVELWLTKLEAFAHGRSAADARALLVDRGLRAVAAATQGGLLLSEGDERTTHRDHYRRRLDLLAELAVPTLVVAADHLQREATGEDYGRAIAHLAEACELAARAEIRLALEFQKTSRFCASLDTAIALVAQAGAANLGVCLDLFHYYTGPSKFEDLAYLTPANLAWVQLSDVSGVPREMAGDADRILPGEGDFQLDPILDHLAGLGYDGHLSLEVTNPMLWSVPPDRLADAGLKAMTRALGGRPAAASPTLAPGASS